MPPKIERIIKNNQDYTKKYYCGPNMASVGALIAEKMIRSNIITNRKVFTNKDWNVWYQRLLKFI
jgi:hypothetical protein